LAAAKAAHAAAAALAKASWEQGKPAETHERSAEAAAKKSAGLAHRAKHLGRQHADAAARAERAADAAVKGGRAALIDELTARRQQLLTDLYAAMKAPLAEVLANGLVLDALLPG